MNPNKLKNFLNSLKSLEEAIKEPVKNNRDIAGIVKNFEFVYETTWKLLKAHLADEGLDTGSPKDVFSKAYKSNLIEDESIWLAMINDRNLSTHTYSVDLAEELVANIKNIYLKVFIDLKNKFQR